MPAPQLSPVPPHSTPVAAAGISVNRFPRPRVAEVGEGKVEIYFLRNSEKEVKDERRGSES